MLKEIVIGYFVEKSLEKVLTELSEFRRGVFRSESAKPGENAGLEHTFPSVCLVGLGRCGSNIALGVSAKVSSTMRAFAPHAGGQSDFPVHVAQAGEAGWNKMLRWAGRQLGIGEIKGAKPPRFLFEPIIVVGDLDKDINERIKNIKEFRHVATTNSKLIVLNLEEIYTSGAGNVPILGQYLARLLLNRNAARSKNTDWQKQHAYLIGSAGIGTNESRLFFYIFSAGGGTGSGMASEFAMAQQFSRQQRMQAIKEANSNRSASSVKSEPLPKQVNASIMFSCGICILPSTFERDAPQAIHSNAGRALCKYFAEEERYFASSSVETSAFRSPLRPWNAMVLISNDIMRIDDARESKGKDGVEDVAAAERAANTYVAQQIFNILTAQALTMDYDRQMLASAGIDIGDTCRLDASDLNMSLTGPVAVAYAESSATLGKSGPVDMEDLLFRAVSLPSRNVATGAIEGMSILPAPRNEYAALLEKAARSDKGRDWSVLADQNLFKRAASVVVVVSIPKDTKLARKSMDELKLALGRLFPKTKLKRYALVVAAASDLALTILISKSACLSNDATRYILAYINRSFAKEEVQRSGKIREAMLTFLEQDKDDDSCIAGLLNEEEDPSAITVANWMDVKNVHEIKGMELSEDPSQLVDLDSLRLSKRDVLDALRYMRRVLRHWVDEPELLDLSKLSVRSGPDTDPTLAPKPTNKIVAPSPKRSDIESPPEFFKHP